MKQVKQFLLIIAFLVLFSVGATKVHALTWSTGTIDTTGNVGTHNSVAIDSSGNLLVAYYDTDNGSLDFSKSTNGGSSWSTSTIDAASGVINYVTFIVDSSDNYYISYYLAGSDEDLKFAKSTNGGDSWTVSTIESTGDVGSYASMDIDGTDLVIAYVLSTGKSNNLLKLAKSTDSGDSWTLSTVDSGEDQFYIDLLVDGSGNYVVIYQKSFSDTVTRRSTDGGSSWGSENTVDNILISSTSLAADSSGTYYAVISAPGFPSGAILSSYKSEDNGDTWSPTSIDTTMGGGLQVPIVSSSSDVLYVAYPDETESDNNLAFAISEDGGDTWSTEIVETNNDVGEWPSIAVSSSYIFVSHYDDTNDDLRYAIVTLDSAAPSLSLNAVSDPTNDTTPALTGTATDASGTVSAVQFQMNSTSGSWTACTADDGSFDEASEAFTCTVTTELSEGSHTIYVRATDSASNTTSSGSEASDSFVIDTIQPSSFSILSPSGYTNSATKPTLKFKKATDATAGMSTYTVLLDSGKNKSYSISNIPANGDGKSSWTWKDDKNVKVIFKNEHDSDSTNDEIHVYFKDLDTTPLSQGKHSWKVVAYDTLGNNRSQSVDFYLDQTNPTINSFSIAGTLISANSENKLDSAFRAPQITGSLSDPYKGSVLKRENGITDVYETVSSGLSKAEIKWLKLESGTPTNNPIFTIYHTQTLPYVNQKNDPNNGKSAEINSQLSLALPDGYYKVELTITDSAGNSASRTAFVGLNYALPTQSSENSSGQSQQLEVTILDENTTPSDSQNSDENQEEEKTQQEEENEGTTVEITVVNDSGDPVAGARVELHSEPKVSYTDDTGIARFYNILAGKHEIVIAYDGYEGTKDIEIENDPTIETVDLVVEVKRVNSIKSPSTWMFGLSIGFLLLILFLGVVAWRKKITLREMVSFITSKNHSP